MTDRSRFFSWGLAAVSVCVLTSSIARADDMGSVSGTVTDRFTGAPVAEANVAVVAFAESNVLRVKTNRVGRYDLVGLAAGQYEAFVSRDGFDTSYSKFTVCPAGETVVDVWMFSRGGAAPPAQPTPKLFSTSPTIVTNGPGTGMPDLRCY